MLSRPGKSAPVLPGDPAHPQFATEFVEKLLADAKSAGASDIHLVPSSAGLESYWRVDGTLRRVGLAPASVAPNIVARLKVLSELLTYRSDVPQEGRIRSNQGEVEMRVSTFPTLFGEKAVVRLFSAADTHQRLGDLGLPEEILDSLRRRLADTGGAIILSGPAGSGKTTTIYACLRELACAGEGRRSLTTLEDPIEMALEGVSQSQVNPAGGFTLETGLRSLLRQDPEVIAVGEIRDRPTAEVAFQASLTGHLILTTFHAGSAAEAVGRLLDIGIEPYVLRSGLRCVISQRLVRKLCTCAVVDPREEARLELQVAHVHKPVGCALCANTGYRGRMVLAELLDTDAPGVGRAILERQEVSKLEALAVEAGMKTRWARALTAIEAGQTSPAEAIRVLGLPRRQA